MSMHAPPGMTAFGVYIHIPFCAKRCDYCAFATWTDRDHLQKAYVSAVVTEIGRAVNQGLPAATSVFFGGGTPSRLPAEELMRILEAIPLVGGAEITVECNPDTVSGTMLAGYRSGGVSRISLGVQSMVADVLAALGRSHDPANVTSSVELVRAAGFSNFNLDLIYGGAGESVQDWAKTLEAAAALDPPHVSAYALTVEAGTPLASDPTRHPDDDDQADKYDLAHDVFKHQGLTNYEISNWARPGHECRHNWLYWQQGDYRGFGCAAHSHDHGRRFWNVRTPERYIALVDDGNDPMQGEERLDGPAMALEAAQLQLRTRAGVDRALVGEKDRLEFLEAGLVTEIGNRLVLTVRGRMMANEVAVRLLTP